MLDSNYPALYRAANQSSIRAQKTFLMIVKLQSSILIGAGVLSLIGTRSTPAAVLAAIAFLGGVFVSLVAAFRGYENIWYRTRAVAESVKTSTWRFAMRAEPYDGVDEATGERSFRAMLLRILNEHRDLG